MGALAATTTAGYGVLFYAYGVLLVPMARDLGWRRSTLSGAFSAALLVSALLTIPVGRWLDRHPPRTLLTGGAVASTVLVGLWATATHPVVYFVVWIGLGACMAVLFYEPAFTIITKRLHGHARHRAVTSVTLVAGLASTIFGPLTALLEGTFGWRGAVLVLGLLLGAVTIPLFRWALREPEEPVVIPVHVADTALRDALATARFWSLTTAYLLSAVVTYAVAVHLVAYLRGEGWGSGRAAIALGSIGLVQVLGRSAFARLSLRRSAGPLGTWVLAAKAVGLAALVISPTVPGVVVFVSVYGAANGLQTLTRATVIADLYGVAHYGAISSVVSAVGAVGGSLSPFAVAAAIELVGADEPVLWGLVGFSVCSAVANELAVGTRREVDSATAAAVPLGQRYLPTDSGSPSPTTTRTADPAGT